MPLALRTLLVLAGATGVAGYCAGQEQLASLAPIPKPIAGVTSESTGGAQPIELCQLIARVNGLPVLSGELMWEVNAEIEKRLEKVPAAQRAEIPEEQLQTARMTMLEQMLVGRLDIKLLYADFVNNVPEANLDAIRVSMKDSFDENYLPELMKKVGAKNRAELIQRLQELGTSLEDRETDFYQTSIAQSWLFQNLKVREEVTHQEMLDYYREKEESYSFPAQVRWEELMVRFDRFRSESDAYYAIAEMGNEAAALMQGKKASEPCFGPIAKRSSQGFTAPQGGVQDWTTRGALASKELDDALFTVPVGHMNPAAPLRSDLGFHIIRILERKDAGKRPFTEVQHEIRDKILSDRRNDAIKAKLAELYSTARIWTVFSGETVGGKPAPGHPQAAQPTP